MKDSVPWRWEEASLTHQGRVRAHNEDAFLARNDVQLWLVADGMGGHEAGDYASQAISSALEPLVYQQRMSEWVETIDDELATVNQKLIDYSLEAFDGRPVGSTIVALTVRESVGLCLWAGDSRLYRLGRNGLQLMTRDHSRVMELIDEGKLSPEQAHSHPDAHVITRAVGVRRRLCLDMAAFDVHEGDTFLLCSDGLYNEVAEAEIEKWMRLASLPAAARKLLESTLEAGARDNVTFVLLRAKLK